LLETFAACKERGCVQFSERVNRCSPLRLERCRGFYIKDRPPKVNIGPFSCPLSSKYAVYNAMR
jgi:hypothetical protein